jgi:hypothetical protein
VRRSLLVAVVWLAVGLPAAAGCGGGSSSDAGESEAPPLAQVSTVPVLPSSSRSPRPAVTSACRLLRPAKVAATLRLSGPRATEGPGGPTYRSCRYQARSQYVQLFVSTEPASGTADQAASLSVKRYIGTLQSLPGLGDAAYYTGAPVTGGTTVQGVVVAVAEGAQMRLINLIGFLQGDAKDGLASLARSVLAQV